MGPDDPRQYPAPRKAEPVPGKDQGDQPEVTHDLLLTDGTVVPSSGGIPTHIAVGDRAIPVLSVTER